MAHGTLPELWRQLKDRAAIERPVPMRFAAGQGFDSMRADRAARSEFGERFDLENFARHRPLRHPVAGILKFFIE